MSAGVDVVSSSLRWLHAIPFNVPTYPLAQDIGVDSSHRLQGNGLGFVAGALWKIIPALQVGARYQQSVSIDYTGTNVFMADLLTSGQTVPDPHRPSRRVSDLIDFYYATQDVTGRLTLPREIAGGVAVAPLPRLSVYLDLQWDRWSDFGDWSFSSVNEGEALNPAFTPEYQEFYGLELNYGTQGVALALRDTMDIKTGLDTGSGAMSPCGPGMPTPRARSTRRDGRPSIPISTATSIPSASATRAPCSRSGGRREGQRPVLRSLRPLRRGRSGRVLFPRLRDGLRLGPSHVRGRRGPGLLSRRIPGIK